MNREDKKGQLPATNKGHTPTPLGKGETPPASGIPFLDQQLQQKSHFGLPPNVQAQMEGHFKTDLSQLKVKPNSTEANALQAKAFARGSEIHFASGEYQPNTTQGKELIGHEVAHTVQQKKGEVKPTGNLNGKAINDNPGLEKAADKEGKAAAQFKPTPVQSFTFNQQDRLQPGMRFGGRLVEHKVLQPKMQGSATLQLYRGSDFLQAQVTHGGTTTVTQMAWKDWLNLKTGTAMLLFLESGVTIANGVLQLQAAQKDQEDDHTVRVASAWATIGIGISKFTRGLTLLLQQLATSDEGKAYATKFMNVLRLLEGVASAISGGALKKAANLAFGCVKVIRSVGRILIGDTQTSWRYVMDALHYVESALTALIAYQSPTTATEALTGTVAGSKTVRATIDTVLDRRKNKEPADEERPLLDHNEEPDLEAGHSSDGESGYEADSEDLA